MKFAHVTLPDNFSFEIEVALSPEERVRGLSYRSECGNGMLFVFEGPGWHPMWMYRMRFPIDIVWLDSHGRIVELYEAAQPWPEGANDGRAMGQPGVQSSYMLELVVGSVAAHGLTGGSIVVIR